jgi:hypothetical protein
MAGNFTATEKEAFAGVIALRKLESIITNEKGWNDEARKKCMEFLDSFKIELE